MRNTRGETGPRAAGPPLPLASFTAEAKEALGRSMVRRGLWLLALGRLPPATCGRCRGLEGPADPDVGLATAGCARGRVWACIGDCVDTGTTAPTPLGATAVGREARTGNGSGRSALGLGSGVSVAAWAEDVMNTNASVASWPKAISLNSRELIQERRGRGMCLDGTATSSERLALLKEWPRGRLDPIYKGDNATFG